MEIRKFRIKINEKVFEAEVEEIGGEYIERTEKNTKKAEPSLPEKKASPLSEKTIIAPMPGKVVKINIKKGKQIKKGDVLIIIEAMKMEQEIKSGIAGTVTEIQVEEGNTVNKDQVLILIA